jgi:hypothetical protein
MTGQTATPTKPKMIDFESILELDVDDVFDAGHDYRIEITTEAAEPGTIVFQFRTDGLTDDSPDYDSSAPSVIGNGLWIIGRSVTEAHKITLDISNPADARPVIGRVKSTDSSFVSTIAIHDNASSLQHRGRTPRRGFTITASSPTSGTIRIFTY